MQAMFEKVSDQLHIAWVALRTNMNQIKELEDIVIRQSGQPKEIEPIKKSLEEREKEIKGIQAILKITDHDPHFLIQDFEWNEEFKTHLQKMETSLCLKEEEFQEM